MTELSTVLCIALKYRFPLTDGIIYEDFKFNCSLILRILKDKTMNKITANLQMLQYLFDEKLSQNCI